MAQRSATAILANDATGGGANRRCLSVWHQHASGAAITGSVVQGRGRQGCRQPDVAEGADELAGMVSSFAGCRGYCSADPGWHGGAGAALPPGDGGFVSGGGGDLG